ncbi:ABC transporter ATP-binding protein [Dissulfurirhabdus thermomarina]|uniref:ABC transporter ATP-binding protein n=2 Tax=Dissulfurirhabdus thermomarina TaxID=1765737 RepID=A0A6N9TTH8_DISTH|nr:ABC transporter ATP-binding protein [Dissulfurirhabdus thermomarina]NMX22640.1 ABC transporter ATP-binding protein [Dissulfurirhabdus thermomarina]
MVGLLGPNGSGKTTLLHALLGLVPLAGGEIRLWGRDIHRLTARERARRAALVPQGTGPAFPYPAAEVVLMGRYPHLRPWRGYTERDAAAARSAMDRAGVAPLAERPVTELSGGERQGVLVARSLAQEAPLLLLDEAVSAMDIHRKIELFDLFAEMNRREGATVVAVLHDLNLAALYCRRIVFLRHGRVHADGAAGEVLTPGVIEAVYGTRVLVETHPVTGRPVVCFIPGGSRGTGG